MNYFGHFFFLLLALDLTFFGNWDTAIYIPHLSFSQQHTTRKQTQPLRWLLFTTMKKKKKNCKNSKGVQLKNGSVFGPVKNSTLLGGGGGGAIRKLTTQIDGLQHHHTA